MGAGGIIVIRRLVMELAELDSVKLNLSERKRVRLLEILAKDEGDISKTEMNFLLQCIGNAYDKQC